MRGVVVGDQNHGDLGQNRGEVGRCTTTGNQPQLMAKTKHLATVCTCTLNEREERASTMH